MQWVKWSKLLREYKDTCPRSYLKWTIKTRAACTKQKKERWLSWASHGPNPLFNFSFFFSFFLLSSSCWCYRTWPSQRATVLLMTPHVGAAPYPVTREINHPPFIFSFYFFLSLCWYLFVAKHNLTSAFMSLPVLDKHEGEILTYCHVGLWVYSFGILIFVPRRKREKVLWMEGNGQAQSFSVMKAVRMGMGWMSEIKYLECFSTLSVH